MSSDALSLLATLAGTRLRQHGMSLATAESCTGGWVSMAITAVAGSSDYFDRGFVTYSNLAKQELLGVPQGMLASHGAVSEETARAMAAGALAHSSAQATLSITGVAGPGGGSPTRPVGTVCFGWAVLDLIAPESATRLFDGDRDQIRRQAVLYALQGLIERLDRL